MKIEILWRQIRVRYWNAQNKEKRKIAKTKEKEPFYCRMIPADSGTKYSQSKSNVSRLT